jgi:hypothetical protein
VGGGIIVRVRRFGADGGGIEQQLSPLHVAGGVWGWVQQGISFPLLISLRDKK